MRAFEHASPSTVAEAVSLLAQRRGESAVIAGGTDLLSLMKDGVQSPARLVDLNGIGELRRLTHDATGAMSLGALVTLEELLAQRKAPVNGALLQAAEGVTSAQVRAMGTIGGDLCQWPRCWYFRQGHGLLAQRDGKSLVKDGDNRYHAAFGNDGPALYVSASSFAAPLVALGATLVLVGSAGERRVEAAKFFRSPRAEGEKPWDLADDEVLTRVDVPGGRTSATYEVRQRQAFESPLASAAVSFAAKGGRATDVRIVLGHVAPVPWVVAEAAAVVEGQVIDEALASRAADAAVRGAKPLSRNAYKVQLARTCVKRALMRAAGKEV
jgi:xanthine dehydrogenase YagS FAD-binding subunit